MMTDSEILETIEKNQEKILEINPDSCQLLMVQEKK